MGSWNAALEQETVHNYRDEYIRDQKTFEKMPFSAAEGADGTGSQPLATRAYLISREQNLVTNGSGILLNNYNFPGLTAVVCEACPRAFRSGLTIGLTQATELIHVDPNEYYRLHCYVRNGNADGTNYVSNSRFYVGVSCHDRDGSEISSGMYTHVAGAADTTLAAELKPGDTQVYLTSATGWGTATATVRQLTWWPYSSGDGCVYAPYTYSRNTTQRHAPYVTSGAYSAIVGNTLTLSAPWPVGLGTVAAGSPVRNSQIAGAHHYFVASSATSPQGVLVRRNGKIGGLNLEGTPNDFFRFPYGTSYVHPVLLYNYTTPGAYWYFANVQFVKDQSFNIGEVKTYTPEWRADTTPPVLGNGTISGKYSVVGQNMFVDLELLIGSTSTVGSGEYSFTPPPGYTYDNLTPLGIGAVSILDSSAVEYWSGWAYYGAPSPVGIRMRTPSATPQKGDQPVTTSHPIVPAVGDRYRVSVRLKLTGVFA